MHPLSPIVVGLVLNLALAQLFGSPAAAQLRPRPRIVNGVLDNDSPEVGSLLDVGGFGGFERRNGVCTGTLIGCSTFLVAAHCVCDESDLTAAGCAKFGPTPAENLEVFFPHAGVFHVSSVAVAPDFRFQTAGDFAVLQLDEPVTGITPAQLLRASRVAFGTPATIVGYGTTAEDADDAGLKRTGRLVTAECPNDVGAAGHICWNYDATVGPAGTDSNTCYGDSGGPLFVGTGAERLLAGVTSGGEPTCDPNAVSWNADVTSDLAFIDQAGGGDVGAATCGDLPVIGSDLAVVKTFNQEISENTSFRTEFEVPAGTRSLRIGLNGLESNPGRFGPPNDFDIYLNYGSAPTVEGTSTCVDESEGVWASCVIDNPTAGTWHTLINVANGSGTMQLTVAMLGGGSTAACAGDCDGNGVTVDEIVRGINIALGSTPVGECDAFDADQSGAVTVDEIIQAINNALEGCPS